MTAVHRNRLDAEHDAIVQLIYCAAAGMESWVVPLGRIGQASAAWSLGLTAFDKRTHAIIYSHSTGPRRSDAVTEYVRTYHQIDPRLALISPLPVGKWVACQEHFDDDFVARDPFFQNYLLRHGSRYLYAAKVLEDDATMVVMGHHRPPGNPLVDPGERAAIERIGGHIAEALRIQKQLRSAIECDALGYALLVRLNQPVILLDRDRNITFCNESAKAILDHGDPVSARDGVLFCRGADSDVELTMALRELASLQSDAHVLGKAPEERRILRLRRAGGARDMVATLLALRSGIVAGATGPASRALLVIHEPGPVTEIEPGFLSSVFGFTPAEARVAARLTSGLPVDEIAAEFKVSIATVRTQLKSAFEKTGTKRQAGLVRLLLAASAF